MTNLNCSSKFKYANIFSVIIFFISIILIAFKGLNYGIDFKGGTLIELRSNNTEASSIRDVLKNMDLGDVNVKKFGKAGDFLIKVEQKGDNSKLIVNGDLAQHDRGYADNGLLNFLQRFKNDSSHMMGLIEFGSKEIERHPAVNEVLRIYQS